jgi:hypothetical protein
MGQRYGNKPYKTICCGLKIGIFDAKLPRAGDEDGIKVRFTYNLTGHPKGDKPIRLYRLIHELGGDSGIAGGDSRDCGGKQPGLARHEPEEGIPNKLAKKY